MQIVEAPTDYFEVPVGVLLRATPPTDVIARTLADIETLRDIDNVVLRRLMRSAQDLSLVSLNLLIDFADRLRIAEALPQISADVHIYHRPHHRAKAAVPKPIHLISAEPSGNDRQSHASTVGNSRQSKPVVSTDVQVRITHSVAESKSPLSLRLIVTFCLSTATVTMRS